MRATADNLRRFVTSILTSGGSASPEAGLVADHLVRANLMGHDSHGVYPSAAGTTLWTAAVATFFRAHQITLPF